MPRIALAVLMGASLFVAVTPALAGKGNGGSTSAPTTGTITLDSAAYYGGTVSFTATDPPTKWLPEMSVTCSQNGQPVYLDVQMMSGPNPYHPQFTLSSSTWAANGGGSADCSADLYYYTWQGKTETGIVYMAHKDFVAAASA